jgi:hypothetical protein
MYASTDLKAATEPPRTLDELKCPICGEYFEPSISKDWASCPKAHGKLFHKLSEEELLAVEVARISDAGQRAKLGKFEVVIVANEVLSGSMVIRTEETFTARKKPTPAHILLKCRWKKLARRFCRIGDQAFEIRPIKLKKTPRGKWVRDRR